MRESSAAPGRIAPPVKQFEIEMADREDGPVLQLRGRFEHSSVAEALREARSTIQGAHGASLTIDLAEVSFLNSAGALAVLEMARFAELRGMAARIENATGEQRALIDLIDRRALAARPLVEEPRFHRTAERVGAAAARLAVAFVDMIAFAGRLIAATVRELAHPRSLRWSEVGFGIQHVGIDGLPLVGLLSFLMGFIIATMAVSSLNSLSMNTLISAVVGVAMIQEFGPLIASLVTAGRTGSAFAAEIATMTVDEEVDALAAMGYDPVGFLAVPKLMATMIAVPLITFYADLLGVLGGWVVARTQLRVPTYGYFSLIPSNVSLFSFVVATIKTFVFAFIIATVGCGHGFSARGGAAGVGRATTTAVVAGLLLIIFTDFVFASLVNYLG